MVGHYSLGLVVVAGGLLAVVLVAMVSPALMGRSVTKRQHLAAALALGIAVVAAVGNGYAPGQHVLINRDPGSYSATAVWMHHQGSLEVDQRGTPFEEYSVGGEFAVSPSDHGTGQFQFNHLTSAVLSIGYGLGGQRLMFRLPALMVAIGLLAVYVVAVRATGRSYLSLVARPPWLPRCRSWPWLATPTASLWPSCCCGRVC